MPPQKTLIEFLVELAKNQGWQRMYQAGGDQWRRLVERELSATDAALVLSGDRDALEAAVNEQKTAADIVWMGATVWESQ